jgi:CubicO group peptidase (beta-lactamase class C family)
MLTEKFLFGFVIIIILYSTSISFAQPTFTNLRKPISSETINQTISLAPDSLQLDLFIRETMSSHNIAGLSACVIKNGSVAWHKNYGYADVSENVATSDSTLFLIASISKTFVTTAVMQLWEDNLFQLDDDINQYLPEYLQIRNPEYPDDAITFKMLLTHSSSLNDNADIIYNLVYQGDAPVTLDSLLKNYFIPGGIWYDSNNNFTTEKPGKKCIYSNMGFALLGYLVEQISGISLENYCQENIFHPLKMNNTSWFLNSLNNKLISNQYKWDATTYTSYGYQGVPYYPAAQLRTSAVQLANFLLTYISMGQFNGYTLLENSTVDSIISQQIFDYDYQIWQGLGLYENVYDEEHLWGHTGHWYGAANSMFYHPGEEWGFISLTNTGYWDESYDGETLIAHELVKFAKHLYETYAYKCELDKAFIKPGIDVTKIQAYIYTPNHDQYTCEAQLIDVEQQSVELIPLFNDGTHGDSSSNDNIWTNYCGPINDEKEFSIDIVTKNLSTSKEFTVKDLNRFTSIGPIVYEGYSIVTAGDEEINPGEIHLIKFQITNQSQSKTIENVTAKITALDTFATVFSPSVPLKFGDISPGQSVISTNKKPIEFSPYFSGLIDTVAFVLEIAKDDIVFWRDSLINVVVGIKNTNQLIPISYSLSQNYPNPFNPSTTITFTLQRPEYTTLKIYNILGAEIETLISNKLQAGMHKYTFDGSNLASGVYYYQITAGKFRDVKKMILLR